MTERSETRQLNCFAPCLQNFATNFSLISEFTELLNQLELIHLFFYLTVRKLWRYGNKMSKFIISLPRRLNITIPQLCSVFLKSCDNIRWVEIVLFVALKSARSYSFLSFKTLCYIEKRRENVFSAE